MAPRGETRGGGGEGETETGAVAAVLRVDTDVYDEVGGKVSAGEGVEVVDDGCEME